MFLSNSIAFIQHSVSAANGDSEGTPVAILEASASGLPVISTKHAGIPDVIINYETGILVDEHDVDAMANAMLKLLKEKDLAKKMGQTGKLHIQDNFSMEQYISKLSRAIERSLA